MSRVREMAVDREEVSAHFAGYDVFVAWDRRDSTYVPHLMGLLRHAGVRLWHPPLADTPYTQIDNRTLQIICQCRVVLLVGCGESISVGTAPCDVLMARQEGKVILAGMLSPFPASEVSQFRLAKDEMLDLSVYASAAERVAALIQGLQARGVEVSPFPQPAPVLELAEPGPGDKQYITSPMVGTMHLAPSPEGAPFVRPGDVVGVDAVVCIIEAMQVMCEIRAECCGVVSKVLVRDGEPILYGQPLFEIR